MGTYMVCYVCHRYELLNTLLCCMCIVFMITVYVCMHGCNVLVHSYMHANVFL